MDIKNCVMTDQYKRIQGAKLKLQNKTVSVYKGVNTIGRNKAAVINLKNVNVSQHHAVIIIVDDTQHFISDLNSSNGTYMLNTRLTPFKLYELSNEMEIRFGDEVVSYLKMPNLSTPIHLEMETMEMTQNVTQNFYAATTQLMFDNLSINQTRLSSLPHESIPNRDTQDIHEAATQVVHYPSRITDTNIQENVLVETVNDDIHEAPTQVVVFSPRPSTSKVSSQDTMVRKNYKEDIHEMATQVVVFPSEKNSSSSSDEKNKGREPDISKNVTPIGKSGNSDKLDEPFNPDDESFMKNQNQNADSSVIQDSIIEPTVVEEREENVRTIENDVATNGDSNDSMDFLTIREPFNAETTQINDNPNITDDKKSTTSESQDLEKPKRRVLRKLSSSDELLENQNISKTCNSDSDTDIDDEEKEKILKLNSEAQKSHKASNSDSETDIEDDLPKANKKRLKTIASDSETDIEGELHNLTLTQSEDIVKPKVLSKKSIFSSDSETEIDDNKKQDAKLEAAEDGDSNATEILNDTDCIPATQDAFADMFQYKNSKLSHSSHSQNLSSEESFKLGLTELMNDGENNQSIEQVPTGEGSSVNQIQNSNSSNIGEKKVEDMTSKQKSNEKDECVKADEDIYLMPTQKLIPKNVREDEAKLEVQTFKTASASNVVTDIEKDADEDLYMMPTQKINETEQEHEFKAPAKKFIFKKKATNLEGSLTNIFNSKEEEDPLMTMQKINEAEDNEDDIYMQPTQKLENNSQNTQKIQTLYMQATQDLNLGPNASETKENQTEEDIYMAPTQPLNINSVNARNDQAEKNDLYDLPTQPLSHTFKAVTIQTSQNDQLEKDDLYDLPTQPLSHTLKAVSIQTSQNDQLEKDDLYDLPTQPLSHTLEERDILHSHEEPVPKRQAESRATTKHLIVINQDSPRRKRMKKSDIENLKRAIESNDKRDDAETLSQIDAFVKKPLEKCETEDSDRVETLSQIEAFIKKPFENFSKQEEENKVLIEDKMKEKSEDEPSIKEPSLPKKHLPSKKNIPVSVNQKKDEDIDRPETLSQIEAFVKKPLDVKLPESKNTIKEREKLTKISTEPSEEDLYAAPTQEINQELVDNKITNKSVAKGMAATESSNTELYMLETQKLDSQSDIKTGKITENNKRSFPHVLGHEETVSSAKALKVSNLNIPKKKRMKISDAKKENSDSEDIERPETLSQIDAFIKKPLDPLKSRKLSKIEEKPASSSEESDQINKQHGKSKLTDEFDKPETLTRVSRTRQSTKPFSEENKQKISKTSLEPESTAPTKPQKSNETSAEKLEVDVDKNTSSSEPDTIRSDIDQSFALLEAKSTKTRKSSRVTIAGEIKVAARQNRRSMTTTSIPVFSKKEVESRPMTRKSRKINVNNNVVDSSRQTTDRGVTVKRRSDSSDSDFLESEIPSKKSKVSAVRKSKRKASVAEDFDKVSTTSEESSKEVSSEIANVSNAKRGREKGTVANDIDKPSTSKEVNKQEVSSKTPRANVTRKGKAKATLADDIDKASTTSEESNREEPMKTRGVSAAREHKAKASIAGDIDKASTTSKETNIEESSKTPRASVARKSRATATVADDIDRASTASEESNTEVSSKTTKANMTRKGKGKSMVKEDSDIMSTAGEESNRSKGAATPSISRARASSRMTISKNSEDNKNSESGSAQNPSMATPSRRGRKNVPDDALLVSPERLKRKQRPKVVFTMMDDPQLESLIRQLGGSVVDSVDASTVLVTEHVKRSQKLLTAVGQGKPICSPNWIRASKKANEFLDPWDFILTDKEAESKWNFSLKESISKAANDKLLANYSFQLMVSNATDVLKGAIEACGGKCITRNPQKNAEGFYVVVALPENKSKYLKIKKQNPEVIIVEPEAVFDGVLRQDLRLGRHLLT